jgi:GntR family transcriptional regulator
VDIELDRNSEIPVGVQLAWALRARILAGHLGPGDRLPGVRELAADTGVNVNTVRSVYAKLEADGMAQSEHGRGTFVQAIAPADERLAGVARRALEEATVAGLDPRDVAAALYARLGAPPHGPAEAPADDPAARRRGLREEITSLERALADERLRRAVRNAVVTPPRSAGGRLLSEDELRSQRDMLAARLAAIQAGEPEQPPASEPAPESSPVTRTAPSATRPGIVLRPAFGA